MEKLTAAQEFLEKHRDYHEETESRSLNTKIFSNESNKKESHIHVGHIHYLNKDTGKLRTINNDVVKNAVGWEMRKAGYEVKLPEKSNGLIKFFSNKFELQKDGLKIVRIEKDVIGKEISIFEKSRELYKIRQKEIPELVKFSQFVGQDNIDFALSKINGATIKEVQGIKTEHCQITYSEIAPNIDFQLSCGYNSFRKEIIIKKKPEFTGDFFEIEFDTNSSFIKKIDQRFQEKDIHFRNARVWEENGGRSLDIEMEFLAGKMIKRIPREFLEKAIYPIRTDTTTSYFAGAGDGRMGKYNIADEAAWHTLVAAVSSEWAQYTAAYWEVVIGDLGGSRLVRSSFPFDTSGLDDSAVISAATFHSTAYLTASGAMTSYFRLLAHTRTSNTVLAVGDWDRTKFGSTALATDRLGSDWASAGTEVAWVLNEAGRNAINKTGWTAFGIRDVEWDIGDTYISVCKLNMAFRSSEYANTGSDPYLSVTYTIITQKEVSDLGSGADALSIVNKLTLQDTGQGSDMSGIKAQFNLTESGAGVDLIALITGKIPIADQGSGVDAILKIHAKSILDSGIGNETFLEIKLVKAIQDSGIGADLISAIKAKLLLIEAGAGAEVIGIKSGLKIEDSGVGQDTAEMLGLVDIDDQGVGNDIIKLIVAKLLLQDTGAGADQVVMKGVVDLIDSGAGVDVIAEILAKILIQEAGVGADRIKVPTFYQNKYSKRNTFYQNKYSKRNTFYQNKYF